jgi:predicted RNA-binding protein with PUA-like domain
VQTWILKTEPDECSIDDIRDAPGGIMRWDGIRNFQARNFLRDAVRAGDRCLIWHSGVREPALAGEARVERAGYAEPAQFDRASPLYDPRSDPAAPRWYAIDIRFTRLFARSPGVAAMRAEPDLAGLALLRQGRLSVSPVTPGEWRAISRLVGGERR